MIDCLNITNAHHYGDAMASQHRLRHRVFIERQDYKVPSWQGMEYDQFDTPAAHYLVWRDHFGEVRAVSRLSPTSRPYMLQEVWPDKVSELDLPHSDTIWEGTRFGVDRDLSPRTRVKIIREMVVAYAEFAEMNGIEAYIGVMPIGILRSVYARNGWPVENIGPVWIQDGVRLGAARLPVSPEITQMIRDKTGLHYNILSSNPLPMPQVQAA